MSAREEHISFVARHGLWTEQQVEAFERVEREISDRKLEVIRFSFADQHGILRGKTLMAGEATKAMQAGVWKSVV